MNTNLNELAEVIRLSNVSRGFHPPEGEETNLDRNLMMIIGELVEAQDELRDGHKYDELYYSKPKLPASLVAEVGVARAEQLMDDGMRRKPEGFGIELIDSIIRTLGLMAELGLDIDYLLHIKMEFNATRSYKHEGKAF